MNQRLIIRNAQIAALNDALVLSWLRGEIETLFPEKCAEMGGDRLQPFVTAARDRARSHGFQPADYLSYLTLEMSFGEGFIHGDWAREAMDGDTDTRMQRLRSDAIFRLAALAEHEQRQEAADRQAMASEDAPIEADVPFDAAATRETQEDVPESPPETG